MPRASTRAPGIRRLGLLAKPSDIAGRLVLGQARARAAPLHLYEVLGEMRVAIEGGASNAGAHQLRGEALLRKGDAFAAVEALERARALAHGDPTIAALLAEARHAVAADEARATSADGTSEPEGDTKHYPTHRGGDGGGHGRSGSFTKPLALIAKPGERRTTESGSRRRRSPTSTSATARGRLAAHPTSRASRSTTTISAS